MLQVGSRLFYAYAYEERDTHTVRATDAVVPRFFAKIPRIYESTTVPSLGISLVKHESSFQLSKTSCHMGNVV
jgi:hypothetical protein